MIDESVIVIPETYMDLTVRRGETVATFFHVTMNECAICYSLQLCVTDGFDHHRCADWHACRVRQDENSQPDSIKLTDADVAGLLDRMETQQADMERLKRVEAAALVFVQAREAVDRWRISDGTSFAAINIDHQMAVDALIAIVKGGR